jgi:hypothetical protein
LSLLRFLFPLADPTVIRRGDLSSLLVVYYRFLQLEPLAVFLAEREALLTWERVGVEVGKHAVWGEVKVPGEGGGHGWASFR